MSAILGIDTGGTFTDAVLVEQEYGRVIASAKALTTYQDLAAGIGEAVSAVLSAGAVGPGEIDLVALSTTLATNAIVEGRGSPVCLILIGYDSALISQYGFEDELVTRDVVYIRGGHDGNGDPIAPLDEDAARAAIEERRDRVEAFAVSGYFSVRNPAHELRVRALVEELTGQAGEPVPVTCGHELTSRLNAIRRATTVALNARLIPLLRDLMGRVRSALDGAGIAAPLMVVRGDGSLVRAEWAARRPIETILSGPAASVVGAWRLAGRGDSWVIDMGGTTTDIALLSGGRPRISPEGAQVGRWRTMVEAVDVYTLGLGGDSLVTLGPDRVLQIGPRRVVPLCMLSAGSPEVLDVLHAQQQQTHPLRGQFAISLVNGDLSGAQLRALSEPERDLLRRLSRRPLALTEVVDLLGYGGVALRRIEALAARRLVQIAGFTPTDALHAAGLYAAWPDEASREAASLLAGQLGVSVEEFCQQVISRVSAGAAEAMASKALLDEGLPAGWTREPSAQALLNRAFSMNGRSELACALTLAHPLVAIGAPAEAYLPQAARLLHTEVVIPAHAAVANAVGAAAGGVVQTVRVLIHPRIEDNGVRLYLPEGIVDLGSVEEAVDYAGAAVRPWLAGQARLAGTDQVEIHVTRLDHTAPVSAWLGGEEIYLGTELTFTALGRPSPAVRSH